MLDTVQPGAQEAGTRLYQLSYIDDMARYGFALDVHTQESVYLRASTIKRHGLTSEHIGVQFEARTDASRTTDDPSRDPLVLEPIRIKGRHPVIGQPVPADQRPPYGDANAALAAILSLARAIHDEQAEIKALLHKLEDELE